MYGESLRTQSLAGTATISIGRRAVKGSERSNRTPQRDNGLSLLSQIAWTVENAFVEYEVSPVVFDNLLDLVRRHSGHVVPYKESKTSVHEVNQMERAVKHT